MRWSLIGALIAVAMIQPVTAATYQPNGPIERRYAADGPWATTTTVSNSACDREGNVCDIWYPSTLGGVDKLATKAALSMCRSDA
jgi:hypothetical protein